MGADSTLLARWLAREGDPRPAVHDAAGTASFAEVVDASGRVAASLLCGRASLEGERVALLVSPGRAFAASFFGVLRAGGAVVVLSPLHPAPETRYFCVDAGVRTVIVSPELATHAAALAGTCTVLNATALPDAKPPPASKTPTENDAALQLYTSGTTGKPKGAVLTHGNLGTQQALLAEAWGWRETDTLLHVLPLHHMHGLAIGWLAAAGAGAATRFLPAFHAPSTWHAMADATVLMAVPTIHAKLLATLDAADDATRTRWTASLRALRLVTSGSAALPVTIGERYRALTGSYPLERFGMTEIGVGTSNPLDPSLRRPGTVGLPLPTVKTRVVDSARASGTEPPGRLESLLAAKADAKPRVEGELWVAGPSVFAGYHERPEATGEAFIFEDGTRWFKTGDTVAIEPDGYVRILGRTSVDILKSGGYKLSALEIEECLREHGAVAEVAVVGVPDETWGEKVIAYVVARDGRAGECTTEALRSFARERMAPYKVPKAIVVVDELPRNSMGKVLKATLAKMPE